MKNAAGDYNCNSYIPAELAEAGIPPIHHFEQERGEVPTHFTGELLGWTFRRAWSYWIATAEDPKNGLDYEFAQPMHDLIGQEVRLAGHCLCPSPKDLFWMTFLGKSGKQLLSTSQAEEFKAYPEEVQAHLKKFVIVDDPKSYAEKHGRIVSTNYHIDTQEGLNIFVNTLRLAARIKENRIKAEQQYRINTQVRMQYAMEKLERKYGQETITS